MSIIFGWYSFTIKSFEPEDLDLQEVKWNASTFEIRQKIFHLFWLPLFSLGKRYCIKYNGDLHQAPFEIEELLRSKKVRTPWYSYFIPVVLIVGLIGVGLFTFIAESMMKSQHNSREKVIYETTINHVQTNFDDLKLNAYLRLVNLSQYNKGSARYIKLIDENKTHYTFINRYAIIPFRSNETYYWETGKDTITISKKELITAICYDYESYIEKSCGIELLHDTNKYIIDQIDYFDGPVIDGNIDWDFWDPIRPHEFPYYNTVFRGDRTENRWTFKLPLQNFGSSVDLIQIENMVNDVEWMDSLPISINSYVYLKDTYIQGSTTTNPKELEFTSKFIFIDSLQNIYSYIIKGSDSRFTVSRD